MCSGTALEHFNASLDSSPTSRSIHEIKAFTSLSACEHFNNKPTSKSKRQTAAHNKQFLLIQKKLGFFLHSHYICFFSSCATDVLFCFFSRQHHWQGLHPLLWLLCDTVSSMKWCLDWYEHIPNWHRLPVRLTELFCVLKAHYFLGKRRTVSPHLPACKRKRGGVTFEIIYGTRHIDSRMYKYGVEKK